MTTEDDEFNRIEMESKVRQEYVRSAIERSLREKALQALHDENERLGLYDEAYGIPFVDKDQLKTLLGTDEKK